MILEYNEEFVKKYGKMPFNEFLELYMLIYEKHNSMSEGSKSCKVDDAITKVEAVHNSLDHLTDQTYHLFNRIRQTKERLHGADDTKEEATIDTNAYGSMDSLQQKVDKLQSVIEDCHANMVRIEQAV